jgi:hypothetical protein
MTFDASAASQRRKRLNASWPPRKRLGVVKGLNAEDRAMLYRIALTMAIRAKECARLSADSFIEGDDGLAVVIEAGDAKNRKEAIIPIPKSLADVLRPWLAAKLKETRLWPGLWYRQGAEMLREDLAAAKIDYETNDGYLDFHATRHTAITRGSRVFPILDLKTFARHAKLETTMRYVHTDKAQLREEVERLPLLGHNGNSETGIDSEKSDQKGVRDSDSKSQGASSSRSNGQPTENDATPCEGRGLSSKDSDCHQRARRDSNPQLPDRQSLGVVGSDSVKPSDSEQPISNASKNATKTDERKEMTSDDMLLQLIEAWATLPVARKKMIVMLLSGDIS